MLPRLASLFVCLNLIDSTKTSSRYECGPHGKFEYCLDDFNDCVVGCHCYPGYYFDTTTKICEPSTKLFKESRRFNNKFDFDSVETDFEVRNVRPIQVTTPTPATTKDVIDNKVEALSKNADELSDWLYNQFFKDIESQVINKTDVIKKTRKDGGESTWKGVKIKKKKSSKKKNSKKKKHKRDSLRRQLLKIAEDDSIFESADEDDDKDDDDESESEDDSDEESDSNKSDFVRYKPRDRDEIRILQNGYGNDRDQKEILMLKSEPRPTLPSFILLPNIESPFGMYPLALPPAPPIQMFPMAPLPPMMAPPGLPYCDEVSTVQQSTTGPTETTSTPSTSSTAAEKKEDLVTTKPTAEDQETIPTIPTVKPPPDENEPTEPTLNQDTTTTEENILRFGGKRGRFAGRFLANREEEKKKQGESVHGNKDDRKEALRHRPRPNFMEQLKEKRKKIRDMQSKLKQTNEKLQMINNNNGPQISPIVTQMEKPKENRDFMDDMVFLADEPYSMMYNNMAVKPTTEPIGFKYLSELIHRPENKPNDQPMQPLFTPSRPLPQIPTNENQQPYAAPLDVLSRRAPPVTPTSQTNKFLIELGRQIASLIRKFEIKDLQATKEIEQLRNASIPQASVFSENMGNYGSRSYWERSVRSPTPTSQTPDDELDEKYLNSNERLLQLENKVNKAAKKLSLLELDQLERIANIMEMKKNMELYGKDNETESQPSNSSLNVSLLPIVNDTQNEHANFVLPPNVPVLANLVTNKTQLTDTKNITYTKSKVILKKTVNLFTPNTHLSKQPYKHTWNIDGIGLSEAFPRLAVQVKNESSEKLVTSDMIHNYLANVIRKQFGALYFSTFQTTSKRPLPLLKPIVQMHSPLKYPLYHHSLTVKPLSLNMETEMNKPLKKDFVDRFTTQNIEHLPKTNIPIQNDSRGESKTSIQPQKSYFHHDFHELDYYDRK